MGKSSTVNPDLHNERLNSKVDAEKLHEFLGVNLLLNKTRYRKIRELSIEFKMKINIPEGKDSLD